MIRPVRDLFHQRAAIVRSVELAIDDMPSERHLRIPKMAHGREEKSQPEFVLRDIGGFFAYLGNQNRIVGRIEAVESTRMRIELIAQNDDEAVDGLHGGGPS